jgi:cytochrome c-type biogenesis protein CcmF
VNQVLGSSAVLLGFLAALVGALTLAVGLLGKRNVLLRSGRTYTWMILGAALLAVFAMQRALITHDFSLQYVADNGSRSTPLLFTITGMWSALEGSIILWTVILAGYLTVMQVHFRKKATDPLVGWATLTGFIVALFFFALMLGPANPFKAATVLRSDGPGPNPLLQNHPLVAFHPPMLYLGYVGFTIPFCFAIAALVTGRLNEGWLVETRRWTLFAWGFLTVGIVLGAWWSYEVLGWGGYWAWDPVENASFLPWLCGTAYLHSVMVQERRGMLRVWNLSLLMATFSLTILGTFLTRSGVLDSVHSFTEKPGLGGMILGFFALIVAVSLVLIGWRGDQLRSPGSIDSPVSREGAFLANNVLFAAFAFVVLLGTVFPLLVEAVKGQQISVGRPYFDRMTMPVGLTLLFLMAVAPALPWRKASGELLRTRLQWPAWAGTVTIVLCVVFGLRGLAPLLAFGLGAFAGAAALRQLVLSARRQGARGLIGRANGGMVVHLGVVIIAVAFAASHSFGHRAEIRLQQGESGKVAGHTFTYLGSRTVKSANKTSVEARVRVDGGGVFAPALTQFPFATQAIGTPSVDTGFREDIYLTLSAAAEKPGDPAVIGVAVQPMIMWLWIGGGLMAFGTLLAAWPGRRRRLPTMPASAPIEGLDEHEPEPVGV